MRSSEEKGGKKGRVGVLETNTTNVHTMGAITKWTPTFG